MSKYFQAVVLAIGFLCCPALVSAQVTTSGPPGIVITDSSSNKRTEYLRLGPQDFSVPLLQNQPAWSVEKSTLHGGKQEGCEIITVDSGTLSIVIVPTRGMSVLRVSKSPNSREPGIELSWNSPVKEVVHPQFVNLESRGGLGWLEGFNEWMVRCGLESAGHPGKDEFINNAGDKVEMDLTLHGKIGNIPASKVTVTVDRDAPYRIRVQGIVNERMFYGPKLELITEISTVPGTTTFQITDKLINHGADDQEFQMIYHTNFGKPLLEKNAKVVVAAEKVEPMNAHAAKSIDSFAAYEPPTKGFIEQVYLVYPKSDSNGNARALLKNAAGDQGVTVMWKTSQLPYFTLWKNTAAEADGYVTGLEPGTGFPFNRKIERKFGRVPKLEPNMSRIFELEYSLHLDKEAVSKVESMISQLQDQPPILAAEPISIPKQ